MISVRRGAAACLLSLVFTPGGWGQQAPVTKVKADLYGDALPDGALVRLGTVGLRHEDHVRQLAYSADGKLLAGSNWKTVHVWDPDKTNEIRQFEANDVVTALAFVPGRNRVALGYRGEAVALWDVREKGELHRLQGCAGEVLSLACSADGKTVAAATRKGYGNDAVYVWDVGTQQGRELCRPELYAWTWNVAFSPDGRLIASAGEDFSICLWDVHTGKCARRITGHDNWVTAVAFAAEADVLVSASSDNTVRLWNPATGKELGRLTGMQGHFLRVAVSRDGRTVAAQDWNYAVCLWDAPSGKLTRHVPGDGAMCLDPAGKVLAVGSMYRTIEILDVTTGQERIRFRAHKGPVTSVAFSPDTHLLASSSPDRSLLVWDTATSKPLQHFREAEGKVAFAPDSRGLALASKGGSVRLWSAAAAEATWKKTHQLRGPDPTAVVFSSDNKTLAVGGNGLALFERSTGRALPATVSANARSTVFSADGKSVATLLQDSARVGGKDVLTEIQVGKTVAEVHLGLVGADKPRHRIALQNHEVFWMALSPDGTVFALAANAYQPSAANSPIPAGRQDMLRWWDTRTGRELSRRLIAWNMVQAAAFSPDGRMLALACNDGNVRLWEIASGHARRVLRGHRQGVQAVAFSADGKRLASGGHDSTILIWDVYRPDPQSRGGEGSWLRLGQGAAPAFDTVCALIRYPHEAVALIKQHVRPVGHESAQRLQELIRELDSDRYAVRQRATDELVDACVRGRMLPDDVRLALNKAMTDKRSLEFLKRGDRVLQAVEKLEFTPERLRLLRAFEVLEAVGNAEARQVLRALTSGAPEAWLTREARDTLHRLDAGKEGRP